MLVRCTPLPSGEFTMQIIVKLKDVIIDPAKPVNLTAMAAVVRLDPSSRER